MTQTVRRRSVHPRVVFGFTLVAIGFLFLLDKFLPYRFNLSDFWPLLLIIWGVARFSSHGARGWGFSSALIIFGVFLFLNDFEPFSYIVNWANLWPLGLIALGGYLITKSFNQANATAHESDTGTDDLRATTVLGSRKIKVSSSSFRGGEVTVALGGLEIDMRGATFSTQAPEVVIDVTTIMGGMEINIPESWTVVMKASAVLGEIADKRPKPGVTQAQNPTLVIDGVVLLGAVEIISN